MFRKLSTYVLFLLLGAPFLVMAQGTGTLAGTVVDATTGETLPGANVIIEGTTLGAATDLDGNYRIIGVPVGTYDITAAFVGYESTTELGVEINSGYTRQIDFELRDETVDLEGIEVVYERPIIQRDAIGAPRVVSGEDLQNLPVRGVTAVAALQSGVVADEGSGNLFVRGGREQEVTYYVDGVKVTNGPVAVNQSAVQEQEMLIGSIPARYGDVQSGVISITTKSGRNEFFGSLEAITSEVLDSYGYNLGALSLGGPIIPGKASFFASVSGQYQRDRTPYGVSFLEPNAGALDAINANPQVFAVDCVDTAVCEAGDRQFVPVPTNLEGELLADILADPAAYNINVPAGYMIGANGTLISAADTFTEDQFTSTNSKDAPYQEITFNGNMTLDPIRNLTLRLGGVYETSVTDGYGGFANSFFNVDDYNVDERQTVRLFGTLRQRLSDVAFYQIQGEWSNYDNVVYPQRFSDNLEDALFYGDVDHEANALPARYLTNSGGVLMQRSGDGTFYSGSTFGGGFSHPGSGLNSTYTKRDYSTLRVSGNATAQLGVHQLEFGAEYEKQTRRFFSIGAGSLSRFYADGNVESTPVGGIPETGVTSYSELPWEVLVAQGRVNYYGYSFNGLEEADSQDITAYANGTNYDVAPYEPVYMAGYIQDKIEYRDLVINLGLRVDVFDNNTLVLRDLYAPFLIVRAGDLTADQLAAAGVEGGTLPGNIGGDYAVYFANNNDLNTAVGFRNLDGRFFDLNGNASTQESIESIGRYAQPEGAGTLSPDQFEDYEAQVTVMPRIGVSFPVTDRALFFASYNVTSQRPTEAAFDTFVRYDPAASTGLNFVPNSNLLPEVTTQYELGFRQRIGERAAVTLSGFYRTQENKIAVRDVNQIGASNPTQYVTYLNADFTTAKGAELGFELRRTNNIAVNANYTLSFAQGTGSDANTASTIAWLNGTYPNVLAPADFDRRHTVNVSLDYRLGEDEGPMLGNMYPLEGFGFNVRGVFKSGVPYTPIVGIGDFLNGSAQVPPQGSINNANLPATSQIDLRVDRNFNVGFGNFKAYLWVQNLLGSESPLSVFRFTGNAGSGGVTADPSTLNAAENSVSPESAMFYLNQLEGSPVFNGPGALISGSRTLYAPPRRVRLGILLDF